MDVIKGDDLFFSFLHQEEPNNGGIVSCTTTLDLKIISL
jgi:hypothetical protein